MFYIVKIAFKLQAYKRKNARKPDVFLFLFVDIFAFYAILST